MEYSQVDTITKRPVAEIKTPWDTKLAMFLGAFFAVMIFIINLFNVVQTIPLSIIMFSQMFLFLAGYVEWNALKEYEITVYDKSLFKQKYFLMLASLIVYILGVLLYILLFNSDSNIRLTYLTVIPILLATANNFNLLFEPSKNTSESDLNSVNNGNSDSFYQGVTQYRKMFKIPLILGVIGSVIVILLPWFSTTFNNFGSNSYYNCPSCVNNQNVSPYLTRTTNLYWFFNVGISRYLVYFTIFIIILSGFIVYFSYNYIKTHQSRTVLLIGMALSMFGSFVVISGILTLIYYLLQELQFSYPHILYFSLEVGFIVGFILILFSTSITMNLYKVVSEKYALSNSANKSNY